MPSYLKFQMLKTKTCGNTMRTARYAGEYELYKKVCSMTDFTNCLERLLPPQ